MGSSSSIGFSCLYPVYLALFAAAIGYYTYRLFVLHLPKGPLADWILGVAPPQFWGRLVHAFGEYPH